MSTVEENKKLRELLWLHHGHLDLYGDDGEMQCAKCFVDFKRGDIQSIEDTLNSGSNILKESGLEELLTSEDFLFD